MFDFYTQKSITNLSYKNASPKETIKNYFELAYYSVVYVDSMQNTNFLIEEILGESFPETSAFSLSKSGFILEGAHYSSQNIIYFYVKKLGEVIAYWEYDIEKESVSNKKINDHIQFYNHVLIFMENFEP